MSTLEGMLLMEIQGTLSAGSLKRWVEGFLKSSVSLRTKPALNISSDMLMVKCPRICMAHDMMTMMNSRASRAPSRAHRPRPRNSQPRKAKGLCLSK